MMTIKEILKLYQNEYVDVEIYKFKGKKHTFHTDTLEWIEDYNNNWEVEDYQLMDNYDYNNTIEANSCYTSDFQELYGDNDAKVLVIAVGEFINI